MKRIARSKNYSKMFIESGNSKIVVYEGDIDHIRVYSLFRDVPFSKELERPYSTNAVCAETMAAHKLMQVFLLQKKSLGVVVDEFGGTSGIVSLEDIVEEIFGDIEDEHDNTKVY